MSLSGIWSALPEPARFLADGRRGGHLGAFDAALSVQDPAKFLPADYAMQLGMMPVNGVASDIANANMTGSISAEVGARQITEIPVVAKVALSLP